MYAAKDHRVLWTLFAVLLVSVRGDDSDSSDSSKTEQSQNCSAVMNKVLESAYAGVGWAVETVAIGWTMSAIALFLVLSFLYGHFNGNRLNNEMSSLYNALHRPLWSLAVCWVIFACTSGYGGIVNSFLSWKFFVPFSVISYCTYLVHFDVVRHFLWSQRRMYYMNSINNLYSFIGVLVVSFVVSAMAYLLFEVPIAKLHKAIRRIKNNNRSNYTKVE